MAKIVLPDERPASERIREIFDVYVPYNHGSQEECELVQSAIDKIMVVVSDFQHLGPKRDEEMEIMGRANQGYMHFRTEHPASFREKAFYEEWKKENEDNITGWGRGTLQELFSIPDPKYLAMSQGWRLRITLRERFIVATVMRWLGSNVGWCFLETVFKKCGYELKQVKEMVVPYQDDEF